MFYIWNACVVVYSVFIVEVLYKIAVCRKGGLPALNLRGPNQERGWGPRCLTIGERHV